MDNFDLTSKQTMRKYLKENGAFYDKERKMWLYVNNRGVQELGDLENAYELWISGRLGDI